MVHTVCLSLHSNSDMAQAIRNGLFQQYIFFIFDMMHQINVIEFHINGFGQLNYKSSTYHRLACQYKKL